MQNFVRFICNPSLLAAPKSLLLIARFSLLSLLFISVSIEAKGTPNSSSADVFPLEKVTLQLKWFSQFQFAGYYAALEQGYYEEEGLDVDIRERDLTSDYVNQVIEGKADYGIGDSGLVSQFAKGTPVIALAAVFQHNPLVYFTLQDSWIVSPYEMAGKRIMADTLSHDAVPIKIMLTHANIETKDVTYLPLSGDYGQLIRGEVDVIAGYITNEPYFYKEAGVNINIINPKSYGLNFYSNIIFTSKKELEEHPGRADKFKRASLKGWQYALEHSDEMVNLLHYKYQSKLSIDHLTFEAAATKKLILADVVPLGQIEPERLLSISDAFASTGFNRTLNQKEINQFIYSERTAGLNLTDKEKQWLKNHPVIKVGIDNAFAPYEWVDENGQYKGLAADYIAQVEKKLGISFEIIKDRPWSEIITMAKNGELDILSCVVKTPERSTFLHFTTPYKVTHAVIIDHSKGPFIGSLDNLKGKTVVVEKGYFTEELIRRDHPSIKLVTTTTTIEALDLVATGVATAYVGDAGSANYAIKESGHLNLRFSGQTDYSSPHSIAVVKTQPELASIITKAIASIPATEADAIFNRWLGLTIEQGIKPKTLIKYIIAFSFLLLLIGYWVYILQREIRTRKSAEIREQGRSQVLECLSKGMPLPKVLTLIVENVEFANPTMLCSILILNKDTQQLTYGAAPSLPDFYNLAIDGLSIGEGIGSCGTAAYRAESVIVENVQTHPYWKNFRALTKKAGLTSCWSHPIISNDGQVLGTFAIYHRTPMLPSKRETQLIESYANLAAIVITSHRVENEIRIAATAFESQEGMLVTNAQYIILRVNRAFTRITGYTAAEAIGQTPDILNSNLNDAIARSELWSNVNENGYWEGELWSRHKNGEEYPEHLTINAVKDSYGKITNYVATLTDITLRKEAAEEIERLAFYDPLTQLPNRRLLLDRLHQALVSSKRNGTKGAILFLDLDQFKTLNDTLGHSVGDILLNEVAKRLTHCVRNSDTVARLGGDEFVVILEGLNGHDIQAGTQTENITHKILQALSHPYDLGLEHYTISTSVGAALFHGESTEVDELLKQADIAMYQAKKSGRNTLRFFDKEMQDSINMRVERERELETAVTQKEFQLYYQVQVDEALKPIGAEVLIRWIHPKRGLIPPIEFIPLAEETGLILPIGQWVLESACEQLDQWQSDEKTKDLSLSINVSAKQFHLNDFIEQVENTLKKYKFPTSLLKFELTEGLLLDNIEETANTISTLGTLGIQVSLDDFGTGYSSLQYLKRLPLYQLKIDQSFVRDLPDGNRDIAIVRTIIAMAESLGLNVIAEGVENKEQLECLLHDKCRHFQGYFFSKPVPIDEFTRLLVSDDK